MIKTIQRDVPFHTGKPQLRPKNKIGFQQFSAFNGQLAEYLDNIRKPPDLYADLLSVTSDKVTLIVNVSRAGNCIVFVKKAGLEPPTNEDFVKVEKGGKVRTRMIHISEHYHSSIQLFNHSNPQPPTTRLARPLVTPWFLPRRMTISPSRC